MATHGQQIHLIRRELREIHSKYTNVFEKRPQLQIAFNEFESVLQLDLNLLKKENEIKRNNHELAKFNHDKIAISIAIEKGDEEALTRAKKIFKNQVKRLLQYELFDHLSTEDIEFIKKVKTFHVRANIVSVCNNKVTIEEFPYRMECD